VTLDFQRIPSSQSGNAECSQPTFDKELKKMPLSDDKFAWKKSHPVNQRISPDISSVFCCGLWMRVQFV
jgi:hypothetical protein